MRILLKILLLGICMLQPVGMAAASALHPGSVPKTAVRATTAKPAASSELLRVGLLKGQPKITISATAPFVLRDAATQQGLAKFAANESVQLFVKNHQLILNQKAISATRLELAFASKGTAAYVKVNGRQYRGTLQLQLLPAGIQAINVVPLEEYLYSVLPSEMSPSWPTEALKAQAVAARTFALYDRNKHKSEGFELCATTHCQAYEGVGKETAEARAAVDAVRGQVLEYNGKPIYAAFHASSGGMTANSEDVWGSQLPYLRAVKDDDTQSPSHHWQVKFTLPALQLKLQRAGYDTGLLKRIDLTPLPSGGGRTVDRSVSGRVQIIKFVGARQTAVLTGNEARQALGLKSTLFDLRIVRPEVPFQLGNGSKLSTQKLPDVEEKNFVSERQHVVSGQAGESVLIDGYGWGHGLGLSQWGAKAMAEHGKDYKAILALYYPNTQLKNMD